MADLSGKYDKIAAGFSEAEYPDPQALMERRRDLIVGWGPRLAHGDSVLELGCGDGLLACVLAASGLQVNGVDSSPEMVRQARTRASEWKVDARFEVASVEDYHAARPYDAVVAFMRTFFFYAPDPIAVLARLRPNVRKKLIIDFNPRTDLDPRSAMEAMGRSGFEPVAWRPFMVPRSRRVPSFVLAGLSIAEGVPFLRSVPIRWKFNCLVLAEP